MPCFRDSDFLVHPSRLSSRERCAILMAGSRKGNRAGQLMNDPILCHSPLEGNSKDLHDIHGLASHAEHHVTR